MNENILPILFGLGAILASISVYWLSKRAHQQIHVLVPVKKKNLQKQRHHR